MPTYLILWETRDRMLLGTDPKHQLKLIARMVDVVNEQMHSGVFRENPNLYATGRRIRHYGRYQRGSTS